MASWFDDVRTNPRGVVRPRTPGYQAPAPSPAPAEEYATGTPAAPSGGPASGNTGVSGTGPGGTPPPPVTSGFVRTKENAKGLDLEKWLAGHMSPKYAWVEAAQQFNQSTPEGRAQALAHAQTLNPAFNGWTISGDKLRFGGDPSQLHGDFDGYNEFDAWQGSKVGNWGVQWLPTQRYGQAYGEAAPTTQSAAGAPASPMAVSGPVSNVTPAAQAATPVGTSLPNSPMAVGNGYGVDSGDGFGALMQPWGYEFAFPYFQAPKGAEVFDDPGYQFRQEQGQRAIQRSAAAQGTVLNPATVKALDEYSQGLASQEYGNVYNRRLGEHGRAHDQAFNEFTTAYNVFNRNQDAPFNRLAAIAGLGQTSAGQLGAAGSAFGANYGNTAMQGANAIGNYWGDAANAGAAGRVGGANAWNNAFQGAANGIGQSYYNYMYRPNQQQPPNPFTFGTPVDVNKLGPR